MGPPGRAHSPPCRNSGFGSGSAPPFSCQASRNALKPVRPSATTTSFDFKSCSSRRRKARQLSISSGKGLFCGGAQRTAAVIKQSIRCRPSFLRVDDFWFAKPNSCKASKSQSPLPIACEHAARSVPAMCCRSKADNNERGVGSAECRQRASPINFAPKPAHLFAGYPLAPLHQARASPTFDDGLLKLSKYEIRGAQVPTPFSLYRSHEYSCRCIINPKCSMIFGGWMSHIGPGSRGCCARLICFIRLAPERGVI